ncbi:transient receptor potential cation channel subfamily V member 5 [Agrilus planipennis]|uniref:Transient receptor potential cation channel subfamily V member 5 n=1 Tax=Agrilus planipennis TaxID=224129 RepID=A0A7F5RMT0_AGRPL|nr:transient receptor potential cation channel subfamily V member 5 [Agrilus planipennis]
MGNTESNVTSGVKKQAGASMQAIYKLCDLKGGGLLVELMKRATQNKQFAEIDHAIKTKVEPFLYNRGKGKYIPISQLVLLRNKERPRHKLLPPLKAMENPDDFEIDENAPDVTEEEYQKNPSAYRHTCWKLKERGAVGETILHLCLLNATSLHADIAKRLLKFYPKLINDIYMSDEYYGENVLHIAIVNEDPAMVKFLLESGANYQERCIGSFMSPEDQKSSRTDSLDHEWVNVNPMTNYKGYVYWGEYPLTFAACLGLEECFRLILAKGANPDAQDTNGNTCLHLLVIYNKMEMFDNAYEVGARLSIRNVLHLTPLTLAAKIAQVEMFFHILNLEREIYWQIGSITCAAYPLGEIDTIDIKTGQIIKTSVLNLVVFGDKDEHLELMDGVVIDLLNAKWNTFVKNKFYRQFFTFLFYFLVSLVCFTLRPGPDISESAETTTLPNNSTNLLDHTNNVLNTSTNGTYNPTLIFNSTFYPLNGSDYSLSDDGWPLSDTENVEDSWNISTNFTDIIKSFTTTNNLSQLANFTPKSERITIIPPPKLNLSNINYTKPEMKQLKQLKMWWSTITEECRLMNTDTLESQIRLIAEAVMLFSAFLYLVAAIREARFLGGRMFFENLMTAPSRVMFLFSCILMQIILPLRLSCQDEAEDVVAVVIMLTTAPYFLFFCRGFKTVGPFVVMIYRMVMGDLLRFATIYMVFVMGFSQAFYIIFLSYDNPLTPDEVDDSASNPMSSPAESVMAMFLMSMTNFGDYYTAFEKTQHEYVAKLLFVMYMAIVAILLINMLIAMMGNTYQKIAETRNEWQRQWARIVLVVERGVSPAERLKQLMVYSQPMSDGKRALVLRLNQSDDQKEEMKEILETKRRHERHVKLRQEKLANEAKKKEQNKQF